MQIIKNAFRFNLRKSKFAKLPGEVCIQTPLDASMCALHNMGMHFIILNLSPFTTENVPTPLKS